MDKILILHGSYRRDRQGPRLAHYLHGGLEARGARPELVDAAEVGLPMLDRMYKEHPAGTAPVAMQLLAEKIEAADAFVFVAGEYNWGVQPGLKNLTDHFLEEWFWRPALIASYSAGRLGGAHAALAWRASLSEMGMVVVSSTLTVPQVDRAFDADGRPAGEPGAALARAFARAADDLAWWTQAARAHRAAQRPPTSPMPLRNTPRGRRRSAIVPALAALLLGAGQARAAGAELAGFWRTAAGGGTVAFRSCGDALCGYLVDPAAAPSAEPTLLIERLTRSSGGWSGGRIHDPRSGRSYAGEVRPLGAGRLKVTGCLVRPLCMSQVWRQVR